MLESQKTRRRIKHEERGRNLAGSARNQLIGRNNPENNFDPFDEGREDLFQEKRIIKRVKEKLGQCYTITQILSIYRKLVLLIEIDTFYSVNQQKPV